MLDDHDATFQHVSLRHVEVPGVLIEAVNVVSAILPVFAAAGIDQLDRVPRRFLNEGLSTGSATDETLPRERLQTMNNT